MGSCVCLGRLRGGEFGGGDWWMLVGLLLLVVSEDMWRVAVRRVFGVLDWVWWYGVCCGCECMFPVVLW
jgi:hypothetical protein